MEDVWRQSRAWQGKRSRERGSTMYACEDGGISADGEYTINQGISTRALTAHRRE